MMPRAPKLFRSVRIQFGTMGIYSAQQSPHSYSLNWRNFVFFTFMALVFLLSTAFFFFGARTMSEYGFSFYIIVSGFSATAAFVITIWKRANIFETMDKLENFMEKRNFENFLRFLH